MFSVCVNSAIALEITTDRVEDLTEVLSFVP